MEEPEVFKRRDSISASGPRLKAALTLAIVADVLQFAVLPLVVEGAISPADDFIDVCVGGVLTLLLGWHWEFLPSFAGKLIPGIDMAPLWTLAVTNVYRKTGRTAEVRQGAEAARPVGKGSTHEQ